MYLNEQERALFFKLYFDLLYCVNKKHKIAKEFAAGRYPKCVDPNQAIIVRDKLFDNPAWIDEYLSGYGHKRTKEERAILISWRDHFVKSEFFIMRNHKKYTVFMKAGDETSTKLYGVVGLNHPISEIFDTYNLPTITNALILPFKDVIIYDGMMSSFNIAIGPGMRRNLNDEYRTSKERYGIIESLPFNDSLPRIAKKTILQKPTVPQTKVSDEKIEEIKSLITDFCSNHLSDEYIKMSLRLLEKLRRKRPSPLLRGNPVTWACGIIYAIGSTNFLFDKSQTPHMRASELASHFGISQSTAGNKAGEIYKYFNMTTFDPEWTLPSKLADNPLVWMFETESGYVFDARNAPREVQEELLDLGMIPFIPESQNITPVEYVKKENKPNAPKEKPSQDIEGQIKFDF